jgi:competence protein ComEC
VAVLSLGRGNRYGHPHAEVVARLERAGIGSWRTDRDGTISLFSDGRLVRLSSGGRDTSYTLFP